MMFNDLTILNEKELLITMSSNVPHSTKGTNIKETFFMGDLLMPRKDNRLKSNPRFPGSGLPALAPSRSKFIGTVALKTCESLTHYSCGTAAGFHCTSLVG